MKAVYFGSLLLMCSVTLAYALSNSNAGNAPAEAGLSHQLLASVLPESCVFRGKFEQQKTITGLSKPLLSSGQMFFDCHHGLIWRSQQPFKESMVYTRQQRHFSIIDTAGVFALHGQQHEFMAKLLINLLSGDAQAVYADFTVRTSQTSAGEAAVQVELLPKNSVLKQALTSLSIAKSSAASINIDVVDKLSQQTSVKLYDLQDLSTSGAADSRELCRWTLAGSMIACEVLTNPGQASMNKQAS